MKISMKGFVSNCQAEMHWLKKLIKMIEEGEDIEELQDALENLNVGYLETGFEMLYDVALAVAGKVVTPEETKDFFFDGEDLTKLPFPISDMIKFDKVPVNE